jgi:AraC-like DNA-binding protein
MAALAQLSNMKAPAVCRRFLISFGMTPIQYQRRVRMQEVRRLLLIERLDLAAVRLRVGYHRPLEFVRDYRRRYAILPMEDVETGLGVGGCEVHRWALPASLLVSPIAHEG